MQLGVVHRSSHRTSCVLDEHSPISWDRQQCRSVCLDQILSSYYCSQVLHVRDNTAAGEETQKVKERPHPTQTPTAYMEFTIYHTQTIFAARLSAKLQHQQQVHSSRSTAAGHSSRQRSQYCWSAENYDACRLLAGCRLIECNSRQSLPAGAVLLLLCETLFIFHPRRRHGVGAETGAGHVHTTTLHTIGHGFPYSVSDIETAV